MKKKVLREKYAEPKVEYIEEPTEQVADVVIDKPKRRTTTKRTTKKGRK